jgi:hypothetical protein
MNKPDTNKLVHASGVYTLTRPMTAYGVERIRAILPQILALNEAHKTQLDASIALDITVTTLRNYVAALGIKWHNVNTRGPYVGKKGGQS